MLKINNKLVLLLLSFLSLILLNSCSYETTTVNLGSGFETWSFTNSSEYEFDENLIEVAGGKAQLKVLDLEHSGDDFNSGNHVGTHSVGNGIGLSRYSSSGETSLNAILPSMSSHLVGYWRFEGNYEDSSGRGHHADVNGETSLVANVKIGGRSGVFDGDGDYLEVPELFPVTSGDPRSVSAWVKLNATGQNHTIASWGSNSASSRMDFRISNSNQLRIEVQGFGSNGNAALAADNWYFVAFSCTSNNLNTCSLYIDGALDRAITENVVISTGTDSPLRIGLSIHASGADFDGSIDELAIYDAALSQADIASIYAAQIPNDTDLSASWTPHWDDIVGYWKMDGNWQDSSGNGLHGNEFGDSSFIVDSVVGSQSGTFDGSGDYVEISNYQANDSIVNESFALWVKTESGGTASASIFSRMGFDGSHQGNMNFSLFSPTADHSDMACYYSFNSGGVNSMSFDLQQGVWTHLACVIENKGSYIEARSYKNGKLFHTFTDTPSSYLNDHGNYRIGAQKTVFSRYFSGNVDDIALWDVSLSSTDINIVYNRQKQKYASHYDSEVIDLGSTTAAWPDLSWSTNLPFGKELVGDFDNDGNPDGESSSDYSALDNNLNDGLIGYWTFNEMFPNSVAGEDFLDGSLNSNHGVESGGVSFAEVGLFHSAAGFDGLDDGITVTEGFSYPSISVSVWFNYIPNGLTGTLVNKYSSAFCGWSLRTTSSNQLQVYDDLNGSDLTRYSVPIPSGWNHVVGVIDEFGEQLIYLNGNLAASGFFTAGGNTWASCGGQLFIGQRGTNNQYFKGQIDEVAVWNRELTTAEIQQLYRRGANRVKLQVKSCVDSSCNCKSYGTGGSETDCDGDGTLNTADTDDIHKSEFIGPGGDGTTYYSEAFNRTNTEVTFNCALNITDSDAGVCAPDEITLTAGPKPTAPEFLNIDYTQFVTPPANRYAQYRVYMEADDNTACGGEPCLPELTSVSLNPIGNPRYSSEYIKIKPKSPITFTKLLSAEIDAEPCATFRLSRSDTEYYFDGTNWVPATTDAHRNPASVVESNITKFASDLGAGELEVNAYLASDASQSTQCSVNSIDVKYE